jgi:hypothetical protein
MLETIFAVMSDTAVYIPFSDDLDLEGIRVDFCDEDHFIGTGEETGESYHINYDEVNLETDTFYTLTKLDVSQYISK